jgi:hypothetical protein
MNVLSEMEVSISNNSVKVKDLVKSFDIENECQILI